MVFWMQMLFAAMHPTIVIQDLQFPRAVEALNAVAHHMIVVIVLLQ